MFESIFRKKKKTSSRMIERKKLPEFPNRSSAFARRFRVCWRGGGDNTRCSPSRDAVMTKLKCRARDFLPPMHALPLEKATTNLPAGRKESRRCGDRKELVKGGSRGSSRRADLAWKPERLSPRPIPVAIVRAAIYLLLVLSR